MATSPHSTLDHVQFKPLNRADGSATFRDHLCSILVGVNGPVEVQRRDELPEEAAIEVNVRPLADIGRPRERWLEEVLHALLRSVLLVHLHPRSLIQITLQMMTEPTTSFTRGRGDIMVIPSLVNAAFVGLIDAGLPLRTTAIAGLVAVNADGVLMPEPSEKELATSKSVHAMAFDKDGGILLDESLGVFDFTTWEKVAATLRELCLSALQPRSMDTDFMDIEGAGSDSWLRTALEAKVRQARAWRDATE